MVARVWDVPSAKEILTLKGHTGDIDAVAFSGDGQYIATASKDATVRLWNRKGEHLTPLEGHKGVVSCLAFNPAGTQLASGGTDATLRLWDVAARKELWSMKQTGSVLGVAFDSAGARLATSTSYGHVVLWSASDGKELHTLRNQGMPCVAAFSPNGKQFAVTGGGQIVLYSTDTWVKLQQWPTPGAVYSVAFTPDGTRVIAGNSDGTITIQPLSAALRVARKSALIGA